MRGKSLSSTITSHYRHFNTLLCYLYTVHSVQRHPLAEVQGEIAVQRTIESPDKIVKFMRAFRSAHLYFIFLTLNLSHAALSM